MVLGQRLENSYATPVTYKNGGQISSHGPLGIAPQDCFADEAVWRIWFHTKRAETLIIEVIRQALLRNLPHLFADVTGLSGREVAQNDGETVAGQVGRAQTSSATSDKVSAVARSLQLCRASASDT